jgi:hypothetical protein
MPTRQKMIPALLALLRLGVLSILFFAGWKVSKAWDVLWPMGIVQLVVGGLFIFEAAIWGTALYDRYQRWTGLPDTRQQRERPAASLFESVQVKRFSQLFIGGVNFIMGLSTLGWLSYSIAMYPIALLIIGPIFFVLAVIFMGVFSLGPYKRTLEHEDQPAQEDTVVHPSDF